MTLARDFKLSLGFNQRNSARRGGQPIDVMFTSDNVYVDARSIHFSTSDGTYSSNRSRSALRRGRHDDHRPILRLDETFVDRVLEERQQAIVKAFDVQQAAWLLMETQLRPRQDFEELLQRAPPARDRDEAIGQVGHERLPLVHGRDDAEIR